MMRLGQDLFDDLRWAVRRDDLLGVVVWIVDLFMV